MGCSTVIRTARSIAGTRTVRPPRAHSTRSHRTSRSPTVTDEISSALSLLPADAGEYPDRPSTTQRSHNSPRSGRLAHREHTDRPRRDRHRDRPGGTGVDSPDGSAPIEPETTPAPAEAVGPTQTSATTLVQAPPDSSSGTAPWIALGSISVAAVVLGLFALRRSREHTASPGWPTPMVSPDCTIAESSMPTSKRTVSVARHPLPC